MYPSEYAYHRDSVYRNESASANCRNYPIGLDPTARTKDYIHCDGTPLRLTDSDIGSEQFTISDYYVWTAETRSQLLFIFPTRVNLTTITLHYYSDSTRGLPRLRFYAVPDEFDVWESPSGSYSYVEVAAVPPDGEPAGHRNISIHYDFIVNTKRILLVKFSSSFSFTVSEVEFVHDSCSNKQESARTTTDSEANSSYRSITTNSMSVSLTEVNGRKKIASEFKLVTIANHCNKNFRTNTINNQT